MNPKSLLLGNNYAVKELLKLSSFLVSCLKQSSIGNVRAGNAESKMIENIESAPMIKHDTENLKEIAKSIHSLLGNEANFSVDRRRALKHLESLTGKLSSVDEQKDLQEQLSLKVADAEESLETLQKECLDLENEKKTLTTRIKKRRAEIERTDTRLKTLQSVKPAFTEEFEKVEAELASLFTLYVEKMRNLDYLEAELSKINQRNSLAVERKARNLRESVFEEELHVKESLVGSLQGELSSLQHDSAHDEELDDEALNFNANLAGSHALVANSSADDDIERSQSISNHSLSDENLDEILTDEDSEEIDIGSQDEASIEISDDDGNF